jgi:RNA recognition motif-containing protein
MKDRGSGKARGFGFVTFEKEQSVDNVIKNYQNHVLRGKWIECKRAVAKEKLCNSVPNVSLCESIDNSPSVRKLSTNNEEYTEKLCKSLIDSILDEEE